MIAGLREGGMDKQTGWQMVRKTERQQIDRLIKLFMYGWKD